MKFSDKIHNFLVELWAWAITIGITAGLLAFALWTIKLVLRMIGVI